MTRFLIKLKTIIASTTEFSRFINTESIGTGTSKSIISDTFQNVPFWSPDNITEWFWWDSYMWQVPVDQREGIIQKYFELYRSEFSDDAESFQDLILRKPMFNVFQPA